MATVFEYVPMNKQIQVQETIPTLIILFIHFMINHDHVSIHPPLLLAGITPNARRNEAERPKYLQCINAHSEQIQFIQCQCH